MNKTITCGPFVGSFFEEILTFRPFVQWIEQNIVYDDLFVFTHFNRSFLYERNVVPIYEQYSLDDSKQKHHLNDDISPELYTIIWKTLRNDVVRITDTQPKDILSLFNKYPKNRVKVSMLNKTFNWIDDGREQPLIKDVIVLIPCRTYSVKKLRVMLKHLQNTHNVVVIGDSKIHFQELNHLNTSYDLMLDMYSAIVNVISNAKAVICPLSDWTFLCNLQKVPVFSWGSSNINPYKRGGFFNFNNESYVIPNTKMEHLITSMDRFLEEIK